MSIRSERAAAVAEPQQYANARDAEYADLFAQAPVIFAALNGPKLLLEAANPAFFEVFGGDVSSVGKPVREVLPELAPQGVLDHLEAVFRTGTAYRARDGRLVIGRPGDEREGFFNVTYEPRRDTEGSIDGVIVLAVETTAFHHAQLLASEQRILLEQIARDAPLEEILRGMARTIEELSPDTIVSVLLADVDGQHLRHGAGPSLPPFYNEAIDGIAIGEGVGSCGTAAHTLGTVIVSDISTDALWENYRDLARRAGLAACWSTPIQGTDERLLGTFAMYHREPKAPEPNDIALSIAFARIAALAIERHHTLAAQRAAQERERAAREDLAFILEASTAITREPHYAECLQCLARLTVPALTPLCAVHVLEEGRIRQIAVAATGPAEKDLLASPAIRDEVDAAVARVLASGATETDHKARSPARLSEQAGIRGYVCVPLATRGRTFGVMTLLATDRPLDRHLIALAEELARRAASSADNAHQFSDRVQLARDLQAGLLPPEIPTIPGVDVAASYHPAGEGLDVGGDFYDVFPLPDERWAIMIGDVCGRGARAANTTGLVRHTARAAARLLSDPSAVVGAVNDALNADAADVDTFVSLVYGELRHTSSHLSLNLIRAGHVPPLVRRADGAVEELVQPGLLLGIRPGFDGSPGGVELYPGDSLVMVTDGITEARSADGEFFGEDRLMDSLAVFRPRPTTSAALLHFLTSAVTAFAGSSTVDDQAALILTAT